jgi:hypothetical protein
LLTAQTLSLVFQDGLQLKEDLGAELAAARFQDVGRLQQVATTFHFGGHLLVAQI